MERKKKKKSPFLLSSLKFRVSREERPNPPNSVSHFTSGISERGRKGGGREGGTL